MLLELQDIDGITALSIVIKALTYLVTLLGVGSTIISINLKTLDAQTARAVKRIGLISLSVATVASVIRIPIRSSFLLGGNWEGFMDTELLQLVMNSPLGDSLMMRLFGLSILLSFICFNSLPKVTAFLGALIVCYSFALRGHALNEPNLIFAILVTVHIFALSYWVGGFYPLHHLASEMPSHAGNVTEEFGKKALWTVVALVVAGSTFTLLLVGNPLSLFTHTYGQLLIGKLIIFSSLLGLAAINKIWLTPALLAGEYSAGRSIRLSIKLETLAFIAILLITATFTTISSPE